MKREGTKDWYFIFTLLINYLIISDYLVYEIANPGEIHINVETPEGHYPFIEREFLNPGNGLQCERRMCNDSCCCKKRMAQLRSGCI